MRIKDEECHIHIEDLKSVPANPDTALATENWTYSKPRSFLSRWQFRVLCLVAVAVALLVFFMNQEKEEVAVEQIQWETTPFNSTRAVFITMDPQDKEVLHQLDVLRNLVGFSAVESFAAVDGKKIDSDSLPLYTRYLMEQGRHDHHQVSTSGMVGCYLSHVKVLETMKPGDVFAIFEEDAHFSEDGPLQLKLLHDFVSKAGIEYDAMMIGINRVPAPSGDTYTLSVSEGLDLIGCRKDCTVWGTRGYIITYAGAQKILEHAYPIQTQIDALISLVARYNHDFRLFWTSQDIALGPPLLAIVRDINYSKVQDHCLKCHLPSSNAFYITSIVVFAALLLCMLCRRGGLAARGQLCWCLGDKRVAAVEDAAAAVASAGKASAAACAAMLSPRGSAVEGIGAAAVVAAGEAADLAEVHVQSSTVPQLAAAAAAAAACGPSMCHRRTGSRDGEAQFLSALAVEYGCHRRTGSRDVGPDVAAAAAALVLAAEASAAAAAGGGVAMS